MILQRNSVTISPAGILGRLLSPWSSTLVFSVVFIGLTTLQGVAAWGLLGVSPPVKPGTRKMAERLERVALNAGLLRDQKVNPKAVGVLRRELAKSRDANQELDLRMRIATILLLTGQSEEAVQELIQISRWLEKEPLYFQKGVSCRDRYYRPEGDEDRRSIQWNRHKGRL